MIGIHAGAHHRIGSFGREGDVWMLLAMFPSPYNHAMIADPPGVARWRIWPTNYSHHTSLADRRELYTSSVVIIYRVDTCPPHRDIDMFYAISSVSDKFSYW
jgi:hypothetical protein